MTPSTLSPEAITRTTEKRWICHRLKWGRLYEDQVWELGISGVQLCT